SEVYISRTWKMAVILRKLAQIFIPSSSLRRQVISFLWKSLKVLKRLFKKVPSINAVKTKIKINFNSRKIVFIGHSFHSKTLSSKFLTDYLKKFFDVIIVQDESWMGKPFP